MRTFVCSIFLLLSCWSALPQGEIVLNNRVFNTVVAPLYGPESDPQIVKHGNTTNGTPPGVETYSGALLSGPGFTAQLFGGRTNTPEDDLRPLLSATTLQSGALAGFVNPPPNAIRVGDVSPESHAKLQLRCWDNRGGTITNWLQVLADPTVLRGSSLPFISPPLGGLFFTPPNLIGLESFNLATGAVATARIQINFQTNGIPPPPGYLADEGQIFEDRGNGFSYGWSADRSSHARIQNSAISPDTRYDSFILMESAGGAFWQIELTNGVYRVHLAVGDPLNFNGTYAIEVQGMPALSGMPETGNAWVEGSTVVLVTNGTLTVRSATGSLNNRLCFLDITAVSPPEMLPPSPVNSMEWQVNFLGDPHVAHDIESSSDLIEWTTLGPADVFSKNHFRLSVPVGTNVHQFFRARIVVPSPDP